MIKKSQSLWSRDYFLINRHGVLLRGAVVAIPLEQGLFFNRHRLQRRPSRLVSQSLWSRDYFLIYPRADYRATRRSQSLWSRDYFLMPKSKQTSANAEGRNPFGAGTIF